MQVSSSAKKVNHYIKTMYGSKEVKKPTKMTEATSLIIHTHYVSYISVVI